jgi:putative ABC transport system ATP-binding protein
MDHRQSHRPNQLSGGQQQRIAIARALAGDPSILLVDEPTGNLDSRNGDAVMEILTQLNDLGTTICMVTHDPRYASHAKRQVALLDGRIVEQSVSFESANMHTLDSSATAQVASTQAGVSL